jgi:NTP pyrophosphatase (non-canonical NTP hydrolase)
MSDSFNRLTSAQAERLAMLAEEAGEIAQAVGKILRHGYNSYHPDVPEITNRQLLYREIKDLRGVLFLMSITGDMSTDVTESEVEAAAKKKLRYSHHQHDEPSIILFHSR